MTQNFNKPWLIKELTNQLSNAPQADYRVLNGVNCAASGMCKAPDGSDIPLDELKAIPLNKNDVQLYLKDVDKLTIKEALSLIDEKDVITLLPEANGERLQGSFDAIGNPENYANYFEQKYGDLSILYNDLAKYYGYSLDELYDFTLDKIRDLVNGYFYFLLVTLFEGGVETFLNFLRDVEGVEETNIQLIANGELVLDLDNDNSQGLSGVNTQTVTASANAALGVNITDTTDVNISNLNPVAIMNSATIRIMNYVDGFNETLSVNVGANNLQATFDQATGTLSIDGFGTMLTYEMVLQTITYSRTGASGMFSREIVLNVEDDFGNSISAFSFLNFTDVFFDLNTIATTNSSGRTITNAFANGELGYAVGMLGGDDVSGSSSIAVSMPYTNNADEGHVYSITPDSSFNALGPIDVNVFIFNVEEYTFSANNSDNFGLHLGMVGDINDDGKTDIAIGAPGFNTNDGRVYLDARNWTFTFTNNASDEGLGPLSNRSGDMNNDGIDDILIGAPTAGVNDNGTVYIVKGQLAQYGAFAGFEIYGTGNNDLAGSSVGMVGDVNGDGYGDYLIGATGVGANNGAVYLVYGAQDGTGIYAGANYTLNTNKDTNQLAILGNSDVGDGIGGAVSGIGDFNGDGYDDYMFSALNEAGFNGGMGEIYIAFGQANKPIGTLPTITTIRSSTDNNSFGYALAGAGDFNGDGFSDIIFGDPNFDGDGAGGGSNHGRAYVVFGGTTGEGSGIIEGNTYNIDTLMAVNRGFYIDGLASGDLLGFSVAGGQNVSGYTGDSNNNNIRYDDPFDDILLGAPGVNGNAGEAYLIHGMATTAVDFISVSEGTSTAANDVIRGSYANDTFTQDSLAHTGLTFIGSGGEDTFFLLDDSFHRIQGGNGKDKIVLLNDADIDFTNLDNNRLSDIEEFNLAQDSKSNVIDITLNDIIDMTDDSNHITFLGNSNDAVIVSGAAGWSFSQNELFTSNDGLKYRVDTYVNGEVALSVAETMQIFGI